MKQLYIHRNLYSKSHGIRTLNTRNKQLQRESMAIPKPSVTVILRNMILYHDTGAKSTLCLCEFGRGPKSETHLRYRREGEDAKGRRRGEGEATFRKNRGRAKGL